MKIGFITPWPPQKTGIADYAYDLACGLARAGHNIYVFTTANKPIPGPEDCADKIILSPVSRFDEDKAAQMDRIVYQMGNNSSFHLHMIPLIARIKGIVHLHDMVLQHITAFALYAHGDPLLYRRVLAKWYGPDVARFFFEQLRQNVCPWDTPIVTDYPLFQEVLQHAKACIVHSHFAADKISAAFPALPVNVIPQVYPATGLLKGTETGPFKIGIFGGVDPQKHAEIVIKALKIAVAQTDVPLELHIAGSIHPQCKWILELVEQLGLTQHVFYHGRLPEKEFLERLTKTDLCVGLRSPTMGETSAIIARAMQSGTPVVVNDIGWYAELPSFVPKLDPADPQQAEKLAQLIKTLATRGPAYQQIIAETQAFAKESLDFDRTVEAYVALIHAL